MRGELGAIPRGAPRRAARPFMKVDGRGCWWIERRRVRTAFAAVSRAKPLAQRCSTKRARGSRDKDVGLQLRARGQRYWHHARWRQYQEAAEAFATYHPDHQVPTRAPTGNDLVARSTVDPNDPAWLSQRSAMPATLTAEVRLSCGNSGIGIRVIN